MSWGAEQSATQLTTISDTEQIFDTKPALNPGELCHVTIDVDMAATPTDDLIVRVYTSLDGTNYDDTPYIEFTISKDTDPNQRSFVISGIYQFQVAVLSTGSTDDHTSADMSYRLDGVSV